MHKLSVTCLSLACIAITCSQAVAGQCDGDRSITVVSRPGAIKTTVPFAFESRAEKFSSTAYTYVWCIENLSDRGAFFRWGTEKEDQKYFSSFVQPGDYGFNRLPDSRGTDFDTRTIKFRSADSDVWQSIQTQTVLIRNTRREIVVDDAISARGSRPHMERAQSDLDKQLELYKTSEGLIDFVRLSGNSQLFREFIRKEGKVEFRYASKVTVPIKERALAELGEGTYKSHDPADFAVLDLVLYDIITLNKDEPFSTIGIYAGPADKDLGRLKESSSLPIFLRISAAEAAVVAQVPSFLKEFGDGKTFLPITDRVLVSQLTNILSATDLVVSIRGGKAQYLSMPVRLFVPGSKV